MPINHVSVSSGITTHASGAPVSFTRYDDGTTMVRRTSHVLTVTASQYPSADGKATVWRRFSTFYDPAAPTAAATSYTSSARTVFQLSHT